MVYLCLSEVLLIFKHDQSHVMINGDTHTYIKETISPFVLPNNLDITNPTPLNRNLVLEICKKRDIGRVVCNLAFSFLISSKSRVSLFFH